jgi:hypothetical protein
MSGQHYEADVAIAMLHDHPRNPRRGIDQVVAESIDANGFYGAIVVQRSTGYILAGHTRRRALIANGIENAPVIWVDCDDDTALRILLADNQTAALAEWDDRMLLEVLEELSLAGDGALAGTGFDPDELASLLTEMSLPPAQASPVDRELAKAVGLAAYETTDLRQIILVYERAEYERVIEALESLRVAAGATTFAAVLGPLILDAAGAPQC